VYLNPREPGLTFAELKEIGARVGLRESEINDGFRASGVHTVGHGSKRLGPDRHTRNTWKRPAGGGAYRNRPALVHRLFGRQTIRGYVSESTGFTSNLPAGG
jgi:hypothetical protein